MRGSIVVEEARRPKKKRDNKSGDGAGAGMLKKPKSARQWRYLHPPSTSAQFEPWLRRTIVQADAQKKLRSWSSWSDAHSSGVRLTCRSSRGRNGGSWKRRNEILKKFDIVQCSPNWGTDSTSLIILNCAPGLPGKDREGWKSEKLNICWLAQGAVARGKLWEERHMPLAGWWEVNKLEVDSDRLNFNFSPRYGTWQQHEVNNNNK